MNESWGLFHSGIALLCVISNKQIPEYLSKESWIEVFRKVSGVGEMGKGIKKCKIIIIK